MTGCAHLRHLTRGDGIRLGHVTGKMWERCFQPVPPAASGITMTAPVCQHGLTVEEVPDPEVAAARAQYAHPVPPELDGRVRAQPYVEPAVPLFDDVEAEALRLLDLIYSLWTCEGENPEWDRVTLREVQRDTERLLRAASDMRQARRQRSHSGRTSP